MSNLRKQYYQITQDPPHIIPTTTNSQQHSLPTKHFFFIDFTHQCQLRLLKKRRDLFNYEEPLQIQTYGKSIIVNVEDSSAVQSQLVKYEQQFNKMNKNKKNIYSKLRHKLQQGRQQLRSKSYVVIKQSFIEQITSPLSTKDNPQSSNTLAKATLLPTIHIKYKAMKESALKRIGVFRQGFQH